MKGKWIKKLIILPLIFVVAVGAFMWQNRGGEAEKTYIEMEAPKLPVIRLSYNGRVVGELHGYTAEMEPESIREMIYPLSAEREITVGLLTYGRNVTGVGYEVRSLDGTQLLERNVAETFSYDKENNITAQISLMDLLERGQEYAVMFTLYDGETEIADYYTRVRMSEDGVVAGAINFALDFSDKTFLEEPDEVIIAQLESKSGADNTNLGYTDIYSSYSHVLWGNLHPRKIGEPQISLYEFDRMMTSLVLTYQVVTEGEDGQSEYYDVEEAYCVRFVNEKYYLMTYERQVNQRFSDGDVITEDGDLFLGIVGADEIPMETAQSGTYTAFVQNGQLRCYDGSSGSLRTLFSFGDDDQDIRAAYDQHDIRIVRMGSGGDVDFLVYGYMNAGKHEGQCGIAYYRYLAEENVLEEVFYVASGQNYQRLKEELGTLNYMSDSGLFYLMYKGTVYAVDIEGGEYVELASNVRPGSMSVDEEGGIVAWQEGGGAYAGDSITIYYLDSGESRTVSAPEGERMELLGFIGGDLLYGLVSEADWNDSHVFSASSPIHALEIVNVDGQLESRYEQEGVYLTNIQILEDRITFGRQRLVDGAWEEMDGDVLFCKAEEESTDEALLKDSSTERQKRIYRLALGMKEGTAVTGGCPKLLESGLPALVLGSQAGREENRYFAYSHGKLQGIFYAVADAVACIEPEMGVVVDEAQHMIWNRGNRDSTAQISLSTAETVEDPAMADYLNLFLKKLGSNADCSADLAAGESVFDVLQKHSGRELLDLEGCTVSQILHYLSGGVPVLGLNSGNEAVLLTGYYELYGDLTLKYYNLKTGEVEEIGSEDAEKWFAAAGNRFISAIP